MPGNPPISAAGILQCIWFLFTSLSSLTLRISCYWHSQCVIYTGVQHLDPTGTQTWGLRHRFPQRLRHVIDLRGLRRHASQGLSQGIHWNSAMEFTKIQDTHLTGTQQYDPLGLRTHVSQRLSSVIHWISAMGSMGTQAWDPQDLRTHLSEIQTCDPQGFSHIDPWGFKQDQWELRYGIIRNSGYMFRND